MAKTTGHTIAGDPNAMGSLSARRRLVTGCFAAVLVLGIAIDPVRVDAGGPGGKSRYRSASHGRTPTGASENRSQAANQATNQAANQHGKPTEAKTGLLGFRNLLPGRHSRQSADEGTLLQAVPMDRLTPQAKQKLASVTDKPTLYRQLPTQAFRCDEELFLFLTRKPEAIIGIWDAMGITKVQANRIGPYQIDAVDGCGTSCKIDLIYGDRHLHVFVADGMYDGKFTQKPILGKGVFVFKSTYAQSADGSTTVTGTLDSFIKFESLGADLLARSLGGLIGRSADHNFVETAKFISQISQASETNPEGMLELVDRLPQVDAQTKMQFARVVLNVSQRHANTVAAARLMKDRGIIPTQR